MDNAHFLPSPVSDADWLKRVSRASQRYLDQRAWEEDLVIPQWLKHAGDSIDLISGEFQDVRGWLHHRYGGFMPPQEIRGANIGR